MNAQTQPAHGWIHELDKKHGSGHIETEDGRLVYFERSSVVGGCFKDLTPGSEVRFAEEAGTRVPRARVVHVIS